MRGIVQRHQPLAPALASYRDQRPPPRPARLRQADQLGNSEARRVEKLEQREDAQALRGAVPASVPAALACPRAASRAAGRHLGDREHFRQMPARLRALGRGGRIVVAMPFGDQKAEELPQRRKPPRLRACGKPALRKRRRDSRARRRTRGVGQAPRPRAEILEVAAVGGDACWRSRRAPRRAFPETLRAAPASRVAPAPAARVALKAGAVRPGCARSFRAARLDQDHQSAIMPP